MTQCGRESRRVPPRRASENGTVSTRILVVLAAVVGAALLITLVIVEAMSGTEDRRPPGMPAPWADHLVALTEALAAQDRRLASLAYEEAYSAALASRRWEAMADVGDAALELGDTRRARIAYLTTAFRARVTRSPAGVLRAVDGFSALGDRPVAEQWLRVARRLAKTDSVERARVSEVAKRLADRAAAETDIETPGGQP
jgi:hypothetical protein